MMFEVKVSLTSVPGYASLTLSRILIIDVTARGTVVPKLARIIAFLSPFPEVLPPAAKENETDRKSVITIQVIAIIGIFFIFLFSPMWRLGVKAKIPEPQIDGPGILGSLLTAVVLVLSRPLVSETPPCSGRIIGAAVICPGSDMS